VEQKIIQKHLTARVPSMVQRNIAVSRDLDRVVRQMLSKDPEQRPRNMEAVLERLRNISFYGKMS